MDTSGVMIFARTKDSQRQFSKLFQDRRVSKTYEAVVEGIIKDESGTIDLPIAKYSKSRPLRHIEAGGYEAITHWSVIERYPHSTRVALSPETGRSHQLRLHLAEIGHPILGDTFYGNETLAPRLLLHAKSLTFAEDTGTQERTYEAYTPF